MILWHMGVAALIVYVTLGRRRIDYRFILIGAVVPDVLDGLLGVLWFEGPSGRWIAHSLPAVIVVALVVIVGLSGERRLAWFGLPVGWMLHLVGDAMWSAPRTFLWPAFGTRWASSPAEPYSWDLVTDPLGHWATWGGEVVGALILAWFWVAFRLGEDDRRKQFLKNGYLRA